jgi:salicylate hydroxylase
MLIVGGGIGGLSAALACAQQGAQPRLVERATAFSEVGAGIQMGPNVTRTLYAWGLEKSLREVVFTPQQLQVRDTQSGAVLGILRLGQRCVDTYGAPYFSVHRADLHQVLLAKVMASGAADLRLNVEIDHIHEDADQVIVKGRELSEAFSESWRTEAVVGADGLWSATRQCVLPQSAPRQTGMVAYRALIPLQNLPEKLRQQDVVVWVGSQVHAVMYPVRRGEFLNVVVIVQGQAHEPLEGWDHAAHRRDLQAAMGDMHANLKDVLDVVETWRLWPLCDRSPVKGPHEMAKGRIALLGDAAHPMRPFMAQGAGMAIEDAAQLASCWSRSDLALTERWQNYAKARWARNARVQQKSIRNGALFHVSGPMKWGRDMAMRLMGESLMDVPWLYAGP